MSNSSSTVIREENLSPRRKSLIGKLERFLLWNLWNTAPTQTGFFCERTHEQQKWATVVRICILSIVISYECISACSMPIAVIEKALTIVYFLAANLLFFCPFLRRIFTRELPVPGTSASSVQTYPYPERLRVLYDIHTRTRTSYFRSVCRVHTKPFPGYLPRVLPYKELL